MATRSGLQKWHPDFFDRFGAFTVFDLLVDYLKSGRIKVNRTRFEHPVTYHDPCNYGRKSEALFGHEFYEEPRWVMDQCVENWIDLYPNKGNQYCCGGGGGTLLTPYKEERFYYGRRKIEQIRRTGAKTIVVPCHSCHGQLKALFQENGMADMQVKYLWEVVADNLVIGE